MFQSTASARNSIMSALAGDGQNVWTYVSLTVNRPWFLCHYTVHTPEGDIWETLLLSCAEQIIDVLKKNGSEIDVHQLQLVSPTHLNNSVHWQMDPLVEIWRGTGDNETAFVYRLADGRQYVDALGQLDAAQTDNMTCLLRFIAPSDDSTVSKVLSIDGAHAENTIRLVH